MTRVTWYYDVISPYAYLQSARLDVLPAAVELECLPVLFAGLLDHWGQKGPAEIPAKRVFTFRQTKWRAEKAGVPYRLPPMHPFNPLRALRLAIALGGDLAMIQRLFACVWQDGLLPDDDDGWRGIQQALDVTDGDALVAQPAVKQQLLDNGQRAIAEGVFGVPSFVVDGEVFWGDDSLDFLLDYLADPAMFDDPEIARIETIQPSAVRR